MAGKKSGKSGKKPSTSASAVNPEALAAAAGDANAALLAVSMAAAPDDAKNEAIFLCIVSVFDAQGLNHIDNDQARIVWTTIDDDVIVALGDGITDCITAKGFTCALLAPAFQNLKNMSQVTVVSDLVIGIAVVVTP
jgi:hypothetical protein